MRSQDQQPSGRVDQGFTLIEILIVISVMAIIITSVSAVITVILKTTPPAEVRGDDARSLQGLVTWLPQDVDAAPPDGFNSSVAAWPCAGSAPADSYSLISLRWTESTAVNTNYSSTFRYEKKGDEWIIARYLCNNGGSGPMGVAARNGMTGGLPAWNLASPPAFVEMCDTTVDNAGNCPAGHVIPSTVTTPPEVRSMKLTITRPDGTTSTIDAAPKNPDQNLSDDPNASTNGIPTVSQLNYNVDMFAGETKTIDLNTTHFPADPDGDPISVAIDSSEPMPPGITASTADPMDVTLTAAPSLSPGTITPRLVLIISDHRAGWVDATLTIRIIPEPNDPPTVSPSTYHLQMVPGSTVVLPIGTTHNATDPNGDPMTVSVVSFPLILVGNPPQNDGAVGPMNLRIKSPGSAPLGPTLLPIEIRITDDEGAYVTAFVTLEFIAASSNNDPTASPTNMGINLKAGESISLDLLTTHGLVDPDGDPMSVAFDTSGPTPPFVTTTLDGGLNVTVTADASAPVGLISDPIRLEVSDIHGDDVDITITVTIDPTPPPPSDCVLGSLVASPNPVTRQGNGAGARHLRNDVTVTLTYSGSCDGLTLHYDTGDTSGLGVGTGRVFPPGTPTSIVIFANGNGGTEKWLPGPHVLEATTTSVIAVTSVTTTLTVN